MQELYDIEEIKQLKARYFRALDTNDWALFGDCLSDDCHANYSDGRLVREGRDAIVAFMEKYMSAPTLLSMHHGHTPEITIVDNDHATGIWYLNDMVMDLERKNQMFGAAIYRDEYTRDGDDWKISKTGYNRTFEYLQPIPDDLKIIKNMFEK